MPVGVTLVAARVEGGGGAELDALAGALNTLATSLQRQETLRRESVSDLAHELRTPVSGMLGRIEAAQDGVLDPTENLAGGLRGSAPAQQQGKTARELLDERLANGDIDPDDYNRRRSTLEQHTPAGA